MGILSAAWTVLAPLPLQVAYKKATEPSAGAKVSYAEIASRWANLQLWYWKDKEPTIDRYFAAWVPFRDAWDAGKPDTTGLSAQSSNLWQAELTGAAYKGPGKPFKHPPSPVAVGDVAESTAVLETARTIDEAAPPGPGSPKPIPLWAYAAGGLVALGTAAYAAATVRSFLPRR
jgi:hypothetical protein